MSTPLLSDLREPPVVGRFYMVPTVRYLYRGAKFAWPVIGPRHEDARDLKFPHLHYHFDLRFMGKAMVMAITHGIYDEETAVAGAVLTEPFDILDSYYLRMFGRLPATPTLRKMKCQRATYGYSPKARTLIADRNGGDKIGARYGHGIEARRLADGRLLCPHRKVDLSTFAPDADGIVTCPLHGLRVRCGVSV